MSARELLEELEAKTEHFRDELAHRVSWGAFERAGAVVTELERELDALGLPLAPVETLTRAVLDVAECVHTHLTAGQVAQDRQDIEAQIAELQAKLGTAPAPAPEEPAPEEPAPAEPSTGKKGTGPVPSTFQEPAEPDPGTGGN